MIGGELGVGASQGGVVGGQPDVVGAQRAIVRAQHGVSVPNGGIVGFQAEDPGDAGEVDTVIDEFPDAAQSGDVGVAVAAGAAGGARRFEQSLAFVQP